MELYRYVTAYNAASEMYPSLRTFSIIKETPKGYWIENTGRKWVPKEGKNLFAFSSKADALDNFIARKIKELSILATRQNKLLDYLDSISPGFSRKHSAQSLKRKLQELNRSNYF